MLSTDGDQEPRIHSDNALTVKKRRSRRRLGLSSVSKAFSKSSPLVSPTLQFQQSPRLGFEPSSAVIGHRTIGVDPGTPEHHVVAHGSAGWSSSNPGLVRAHTFGVGTTGSSSSFYDDSRIENTGVGRTPASPLIGDESRHSALMYSTGKSRAVTTPSNDRTSRRPLLRSSTSIPTLGRSSGPVSQYRLESNESRLSGSQFGQGRKRTPIPDRFHEDDVRASFRSALTSGSSIDVNSGTEDSSIITKCSSVSDFFADPARKSSVHGDEDMSVEDAISMYADGFDDKGEAEVTESFILPSQTEEQRSTRLAEAINDSISNAVSRSLITGASSSKPEFLADSSLLDAVSPTLMDVLDDKSRTSFHIHPSITTGSALRDRYGFKKSTQYISVEQYDAWNSSYSKYLIHRQNKWFEFLTENGLSPEDPIRFPPKGPKGKRYIRKGIPPRFRGAAWFWYSGAYVQSLRHPNLYRNLIKQWQDGRLSESIREDVERDLHRTFPDNLHFKPEVPALAATHGAGVDSYNTTHPTETPLILSLRRVLCAYALHNPKTGYCQSLNFLAGLFLLFLPEEKAFWTLQVLTTEYLPGTHNLSLEGANIDLGVLMKALHESMPSLYTRVLTAGPQEPGPPNPARLPPITLCMTPWLMSLFIGSLPIETTLRVWDIYFYEGPRTFFRVGLAIFKAGEKEILRVKDPMEIFLLVQTLPRKLLDANNLLEGCFRRRNGFGHISFERVEELRSERRELFRKGLRRASGEAESTSGGVQRLSKETTGATMTYGTVGRKSRMPGLAL